MAAPRVSVVIPTRNRATRIKRTLDSVLAQTFQDFEIIVVDDGSTDDTESVVLSVGDQRIRYVKKGAPHSCAGARNFGVSLASGAFIAFNDSGDEWLPEKLAVQVEMMRRMPNDVAMLYSSLSRVLLNDRRQALDCPVFNAGDSNLYRRALAMGVSGIYPQTTLIRTEVFRELRGFDETFRCWEDLEFFFRVVKNHRIQFTPGYLSLLYDDSRGVSMNLEAMYEAHRAILAKYADDLGDDLELLVPHYRGAGRYLIPSRHVAYARELLWKVALSKWRRPMDFAFLILAYAGRPVYSFVQKTRRGLGALRGSPPALDANGGIRG
jgi:glycosyltransferase involved in cell wall biosynthesis